MVSVLLIEAVVLGKFAERGKSAILAGALVWAVVAATLMRFPGRVRVCVRRPLRRAARAAANAQWDGDGRARRLHQRDDCRSLDDRQPADRFIISSFASTRFTPSCSSPWSRPCCSAPARSSSSARDRKPKAVRGSMTRRRCSASTSTRICAPTRWPSRHWPPRWLAVADNRRRTHAAAGALRSGLQRVHGLSAGRPPR